MKQHLNSLHWQHWNHLFLTMINLCIQHTWRYNIACTWSIFSSGPTCPRLFKMFTSEKRKRGNILLGTSNSRDVRFEITYTINPTPNSRHWQHWSYVFLILTNSICNGHWEPLGEGWLVHACSRWSPLNRGSNLLEAVFF